MLSGGAEVIIERLGGDIFGKGVDALVDMLGVMPAANALLKTGKNIFGEGFEEILSGIADNALRNITGVNDTPQQMDWGATLDDALLAVKTSAYLGSFGNMNYSNDVVLDSNIDTTLTSNESNGNVNTVEHININEKPDVSNVKLKNIIKDLYKGQNGSNVIGNGTTMDAVRNEMLTGNPTHGTFHTQKLAEYLNALQRRIRAGDLDAYDLAVVNAIIEDIEKILNEK